ncbi:MAG: acetyltransferase [Acidobacteria bacterium]|jgi:sugar O-acyltransferase (sialic acid O-acetyltransferase NeuD family)|nr:acetyltransferase [Acidobacteriota bacterium]
MKSIIIYGASGHGKVIADIIEKSGDQITGFLDDDNNKWGKKYYGYNVLGGEEQFAELCCSNSPESPFFIIGVGDNYTRQKITEKLKTLTKEKITFGTAIHPSAQIAKDVTIGAGTVIMANCVVNTGSHIGGHCIVNTAATIDHDNIIGDFVHISPGAHLGGGVTVGNLSWIGLGASIINNIHIAENSIAGAGAVVIRNVEANTAVVGNPAAFLRKNYLNKE